MAQLFENNSASTLAASIAPGTTTITVQAQDADLFPSCASPDYFKITLEDSSGNIEICTVTARTAGSNSMTVARGQEGTTPLSFDAGSIVELRLTAADVETAMGHPTASPAHPATAISVDDVNLSWGPTGNVQDSLEKIDDKITTLETGLFVRKDGDTMTGFLTLHADPTSAMHAATRQYVDSVALGGGGGSPDLSAINAQLTDHENRIDALEAGGGGGGGGGWVDKTGAIDWPTGISISQWGAGWYKVYVSYPVVGGSNWPQLFTVQYYVLTPYTGVTNTVTHGNPNPSGTPPVMAGDYQHPWPIFLDFVNQFMIVEDNGGVPVYHPGRVQRVWKLGA